MTDTACVGQTSGVVAARVLEVRPHPNAHSIRLAVIDLGNGIKRQVVYGGFRLLRPLDMVPAAPPGTRLPGRKKMRRRNYRGESSFGMLCSTDELGWTHGGDDAVPLLDPELVPGTSLDSVEWERLLIDAD